MEVFKVVNFILIYSFFNGFLNVMFLEWGFIFVFMDYKEYVFMMIFFFVGVIFLIMGFFCFGFIIVYLFELFFVVFILGVVVYIVIS